MIAAFAADQADTAGPAVYLGIGQRDFQRGVSGFRAGIAEEYMVETIGRELGDAAGEFESLRDAELEWRRIVQPLGLLRNRRRDLGAAVAGIGAPHARGAVDDLAAVDGEVMHVFG